MVRIFRRWNALQRRLNQTRPIRRGLEHGMSSSPVPGGIIDDIHTDVPSPA
jgi:hypothetical protein